MRQVTKIFLLMMVALLGFRQTAGAFALGGPIANGGDSWQDATIGYNESGDLNAPKNIGEEYRRNVPVMYYTFDDIFLGTYGTAGINAIDKAFNMLNRAFTNSPTGPVRGLNGYSANLAEIPLETRHQNYRAQALYIIDLTSLTMAEMAEQLGLTDPIRYAWSLHDRYQPAGAACPGGMEYLVVQRNYDIISSPANQLVYSAYINDVLYSYEVTETCVPPNPLAYVSPEPADTLADVYSPVASLGEFGTGDFYTGLTRDDVAGLRYLISTNNVNFESISTDSTLYSYITNSILNVFPPQVINGTNYTSSTNAGYYTYDGTNGYGDLIKFLAFARTNSLASLQATYPGVQATLLSNAATKVTNANIVTFYTNGPIGSSYGLAPVLVIVTNYTTVWEMLYYYSFANIITNLPFNHSGKGLQQLITVTVAAPVGSPYASGVVTNETVRNQSVQTADFFVLPLFYTNVCPINIQPQYGFIPDVVTMSNMVGLAITNGTYTNSYLTNYSSYTYELSYFTNYSYIVEPVTCQTTTGATNYFQGIGKIQFVKVPYTNLNYSSGTFVQPITNNYTLISQVNGVLQVQYLQRVVTQPDFLFSASDQTPGPGGNPSQNFFEWSRNLTFDTANEESGLAGPGTITSPTTIKWNKDIPAYYNTGSSLTGTPYFTETPAEDAGDDFYEYYFVFGSFDGTTNDPVIFPNGQSIDNWEHQALIQISPQSFADGALNQPYPAVQFTASGGALSGTLTWAAAGLPQGMSLSLSGLLSGTPTATGSFDFTVTLTDSAGLAVQYNFFILIQ